jgi:2,5-diketo-D-gluconate reductase A
MEYVTLNNDVKMPILGFGVYQIPPRECERCVFDAISVGYRSIDTAQAYGNEGGVGNAVQKSGIPREDFFITSKVWTSGYQNTKKSIDESLHKLKSDYIDLLLIHQPFGNDMETYRAMEDSYKDGKLKAIGLSNFYGDDFLAIAENSKVAPAVNQVETHIFFQQKETKELLKPFSTQLESWAPFAEGKNNMFKNPKLVEIANRRNKTVAQIILRFLIQKNIVVIPKSTRRERMEENFNVFDFELNHEDLNQISSLDTNHTLFNWP